MRYSNIPARVYSILGWNPGRKDPLPPEYDGPAFHYTSITGVHGMLEAGHAWASHVGDLNDPTERIYGWQVIRDRLAETPPAASRTTTIEILNEICAEATDAAEEYPPAFVLSASTRSDSLTQYRLYGQVQVEVAGGVWTAGTQHDSEPGLLAIWREVLYGPGPAAPFVDATLQQAVGVLEQDDELPTEAFFSSAMAVLEFLALHIKNPAYGDEGEVRLVFLLDPFTDEPSTVTRVRVDGERLVTYLEARPHDLLTDELVQSVMLGPLAGGPRMANALKLHHARHARRRNPEPKYDPPFLSVGESEKPFRV